ncbi:hypothetical protein PV702_02135 [Streptomyces sp. FL06-04B]|uniref:hypothetical protein n=1 Tax=Streptomyces TaxID=1883 RepID=UPI0029B988DF|nr:MULTISPECIES: hypothetical protein [unclassified Streptomyces]MDX2920498.1 hypothetical protein [Streptomyces sp. NE06-03C]MDX3605261.1 hypothetical protein [Streptomyces sp. FL06-04B]MDX3605294.1 hypothetical protein [Streptomyces sp. FL06-04B]MDX3737296.1 hypothetical protein [Streptomyces sp. ID01-15D]
MFEPTAEEVPLKPDETLTVEWFAEKTDGMVSLDEGDLVVSAPSGGYTRVWGSGGAEIYVGPDSRSDAR